jgi:clan AA aspartic protease (TIGR02281 family)
MKPKISSFIGIALVILIGAGSFFGCAEIKAYAGSEFSLLYKRLGIAPLPAKLELQTDINRGLTGLVREACDKRAIFSLGEALLKSGSDRIAANAYLGFAATCPNGEGEKYRAAGILFAIADYKPVIAIMTDLIAVRPEVDSYRYLRALSLIGSKRYEEALTDYANTIELQHDQRNLGEWVFFEMSSAYASLKQYCLAITPIQTWVAIDPANRDTPLARKMILDYSRQGNCELRYAVGSDTFPRTDDSTIQVRVDVNGSTGTFILDTGASFVTVTSNFALRSKVDVLRQSVQTQTANGVSESLLGRAASVRVGRAEAADVAILVQDRSLGRGIDGLLGMSFLSRFNLSIAKGEWKLSPKS